jgi:hypothetical protein
MKTWPLGKSVLMGRIELLNDVTEGILLSVWCHIMYYQVTIKKIQHCANRVHLFFFCVVLKANNDKYPTPHLLFL